MRERYYNCRSFYKIARKVICVDIEKNEHTSSWLDELSSHSVKEPPPAPDLLIRIVFESGWRNPSSFEGVRIENPLNSDKRRFIFDKPGFSGLLERKNEGFVANFIGDTSSALGLDVMLRGALSILFESEGMLLIHASAVLQNGKAWVFCGPTGSGKSTIALELSDCAMPIALDRVVIEACQEQNLFVHSTPFSDLNAQLSGNFSVPLAGLCFIEQASQHDISVLQSKEIVSQLLSNVTAFYRTPEELQELLKTVGIVAETGACFRLRFRKDNGFWPLLYKRNGSIQ
jgi:hypothetical protein